MTHILFYIIVTIGFLAGSEIGGNLGSFAGGLLAFSACLLGADLIQAQRGVDGFLLRHRGHFLEFLSVVIGIIVGRHLTDGFIGTIGGLAAGIFIGRRLTNTLGWGGDSLDQEIGVRIAYVAVLNSVLTSDGAPSERERRELHESVKRLLAAFGYNYESDVALIIEQAIRFTSEIDIPSFISQLPREWQQQLLLDTMRMIYSSRPVNTQKRHMLELMFDWTGMNDRSLLMLYDRDAAVTDDMRRQWLDELGLPPSATAEQIESAYRNIAKKYHPDLLRDLPPQVVQLASSKLAAANAAYRGLKNTTGRAATFEFRAAADDDIVLPVDGKPLTCRCWLCAKKNRIPAEADFGTARCGQCHALLGALQDAL